MKEIQTLDGLCSPCVYINISPKEKKTHTYHLRRSHLITMPSKKDKHQVLTNVKSQTIPLANSTNITPTNTYQSVTTNHISTLTTKKSNLKHDATQSLNHFSLIRDQKHELDELNNRFSIYVDTLRKKSKENDDLQKTVDGEKQKTSIFIEHFPSSFKSSSSRKSFQTRLQ